MTLASSCWTRNGGYFVQRYPVPDKLRPFLRPLGTFEDYDLYHDEHWIIAFYGPLTYLVCTEHSANQNAMESWLAGVRLKHQQVEFLQP